MGTTVTDVIESKSPKQSISPTRQGKPFYSSSSLPLCGSCIVVIIHLLLLHHRHCRQFLTTTHHLPAASPEFQLPNCPIAQSLLLSCHTYKALSASQVPSSARRSILSPSRTLRLMLRRPSHLHHRLDQDNHSKAPTPRNITRLRFPEAPSAWSPIRLSSLLGVVVQRLLEEPSSPASLL